MRGDERANWLFGQQPVAEMVDSANVVTGSNFRARKYNKPRDRSSRNFVPVTIFARVRSSDTGC
jgi:hypothetical protein